MTEHEIQKQTAGILARVLDKSVVWFAVPNGGERHVAVAAKLKAEGVKSGVADLLFFWGGRMCAIEMKTPKGRQQASQKEFAKAWTRAGGHYQICRSADDVLNHLKKLGCPMRGRITA